MSWIFFYGQFKEPWSRFRDALDLNHVKRGNPNIHTPTTSNSHRKSHARLSLVVECREYYRIRPISIGFATLSEGVDGEKHEQNVCGLKRKSIGKVISIVEQVSAHIWDCYVEVLLWWYEQRGRHSYLEARSHAYTSSILDGQFEDSSKHSVELKRP